MLVLGICLFVKNDYKFISNRKYDYDLDGEAIFIGLAHHGKEVVIKWIQR